MPNEYSIKGILNVSDEVSFTDESGAEYKECDMLPVENLLAALLKCKFLTVKSLLEKSRIPFTYVDGDAICYLSTEEIRRIYKIEMNIYLDKDKVPKERFDTITELSSKHCVVEQSINNDIEIIGQYHLK